jgi:bacterioferritin-associated ferredoxin
MIVCHCTGVTDRAIRRMIGEGVATLGEITDRTGAGACCESCRQEIHTLIAEYTPLAAPQ